jgi:hypothetical protein
MLKMEKSLSFHPNFNGNFFQTERTSILSKSNERENFPKLEIKLIKAKNEESIYNKYNITEEIYNKFVSKKLISRRKNKLNVQLLEVRKDSICEEILRR